MATIPIYRQQPADPGAVSAPQSGAGPGRVADPIVAAAAGITNSLARGVAQMRAEYDRRSEEERKLTMRADAAKARSLFRIELTRQVYDFKHRQIAEGEDLDSVIQEYMDNAIKFAEGLKNDSENGVPNFRTDEAQELFDIAVMEDIASHQAVLMDEGFERSKRETFSRLDAAADLSVVSGGDSVVDDLQAIRDERISNGMDRGNAEMQFREDVETAFQKEVTVAINDIMATVTALDGINDPSDIDAAADEAKAKWDGLVESLDSSESVFAKYRDVDGVEFDAISTLAKAKLAGMLSDIESARAAKEAAYQRERQNDIVGAGTLLRTNMIRAIEEGAASGRMLDFDAMAREAASQWNDSEDAGGTLYEVKPEDLEPFISDAASAYRVRDAVRGVLEAPKQISLNFNLYTESRDVSTREGYDSFVEDVANAVMSGELSPSVGNMLIGQAESSYKAAGVPGAKAAAAAGAKISAENDRILGLHLNRITALARSGGIYAIPQGRFGAMGKFLTSGGRHTSTYSHIPGGKPFRGRRGAITLIEDSDKVFISYIDAVNKYVDAMTKTGESIVEEDLEIIANSFFLPRTERIFDSRDGVLDNPARWDELIEKIGELGLVGEPPPPGGDAHSMLNMPDFETLKGPVGIIGVPAYVVDDLNRAKDAMD